MDPNDEDDRSGLRTGFALAWGVAIAAIVAAIVLGSLLGAAFGGRSGARGFIAGMLPPLALLGLLASCWLTGRKRMASGVLAAFGTMFAVALLGIAACFGMIGFGGF
jgi:hypothetical protein